MLYFLSHKPIVRIVKTDNVYHVIGMHKDGRTFHQRFDSKVLAEAWIKYNVAN
jgi:hypothetical protein